MMIKMKKGFTLIELVLAMGMFVIVSLSLILSMVTSQRILDNMPYDLYATGLLNRYAEELRKEVYANVGTANLPYYNTAQNFYFDSTNPSQQPENYSQA